MTTTLRQTDKFELFSGSGMGKGCYAILNKTTKETTDWNTGSEGIEWAEHLILLSDEDFDKECEKLEFS